MGLAMQGREWPFFLTNRLLRQIGSVCWIRRKCRLSLEDVMNSLFVIGKIKAFIVFLLLVSSSAYASAEMGTWGLIDVNENASWFVRKDITHFGKYRGSEILVSVAKDMTITADNMKELEFKKGWFLFARIRVNCNNRSLGVEYISELDPNGNVVGRDFFSRVKMEPVNPRDPWGKVLASVCSQKR